MPIRLKAILVIVSILAVVTIANMAMSMLLTQDRLFKTVESDMSAVANVADELVGSEIRVLRANAQTLAHDLADVDDAQLAETLRELLGAYGDFIGATVLTRNGVIAQGGLAPIEVGELDEVQLEWAFEGIQSISTTRGGTAELPLSFHGYLPITGQGTSVTHILIVSIKGQIFSELLDDFTVWESGSIFIIDGEGTMIANRQHDMVARRDNYIEMFEDGQDLAGYAALFSKMIEGGSGSMTFPHEGAEQLCSWKPITESRAGWVLGVVAPLIESPAAQVKNARIASAVLFLLLGTIAAILFSSLIAKPYHRIETQNKRLAELNEEAKSASEAKSVFLATMSHEMRTPLTAVVGLSELMLSTDELEGEAADNLTKIHGAGMTLLGIVNDILDISKIESGRFELVPVSYDSSSLINDVVALNAIRIRDRPVDFCLHVDERLPKSLQGDDLRVKQICNNLLSNAFKYTRAGRVDLSFKSEGDEEGIWLLVEVADTGIGIMPEDKERLFSEYSQVDTRANRAIEGTGLGLSITKRLVEMMDGSISVQSERGVGSTFSVRLRQGVLDDEPIGRMTARNLEDFCYLDMRRDDNVKFKRVPMPYASVLIVDDVQTNLDVTRGLMRPYGMTIDCVTNGVAAIERIRNGKPHYDAIFMDHMMPGMDGVEAARIIHEELDSDYARHIPIIALTANAVTGSEQMFLDNGFQAFLSKPIDVGRLDAILRQWVRDKERELPAADSPNPEQAAGGAGVVAGAVVAGGAGAVAAGCTGAVAAGGAGAVAAGCTGAAAVACAPSVATPAPGPGAPPPTPPPTSPAVEAPISLGRPERAVETEALFAIEGMDMARCLGQFGGDVAVAMEVLASFAANTEFLLERMEAGLTSDLAEYAVVVHGIKGSCCGVYANALCREAEALEHAARAGQAQVVAERNAAFIADTRALLANVAAVLAACSSKSGKPRREAPDPLLLEELARHCDDFDMDGIDATIAELESYEYARDSELVTWLRQHIERMELDEVVTRLMPADEAATASTTLADEAPSTGAASTASTKSTAPSTDAAPEAPSTPEAPPAPRT
ncbi:MAG: response regulator [Coriobacteriales bacterium]|jgi:signal transduction histidine kinase/CheY-like chemotaxis protein|nr:response regulator [Coriobacteriales bacterium]